MTTTDPTNLPATVVPHGIADPVERARAELKAALAAIEQRANFPRRIKKASTRGVARLRRASRERPGLVATGVVVTAAAVGGLVWLVVRGLSK